MSSKSSNFIHVREKKPIALIHVREKKPIALIHGREKKSWHSSMGGKRVFSWMYCPEGLTEMEHGVWRRGGTNMLKVKGKLLPRWGRRQYKS